MTLLAVLFLIASVVNARGAAGDQPAPPCKYEQNCECAAPGVTIRWKAAYCLALNETDDFEQAGVQACLAKPDPAGLKKRRACAQNAYWKERLCRVLHKSAKDVRACVQDPRMIPSIVERGAGGR